LSETWRSETSALETLKTEKNATPKTPRRRENVERGAFKSSKTQTRRLFVERENANVAEFDRIAAVEEAEKTGFVAEARASGRGDATQKNAASTGKRQTRRFESSKFQTRSSIICRARERERCGIRPGRRGRGNRRNRFCRGDPGVAETQRKKTPRRRENVKRGALKVRSFKPVRQLFVERENANVAEFDRVAAVEEAEETGFVAEARASRRRNAKKRRVDGKTSDAAL